MSVRVLQMDERLPRALDFHSAFGRFAYHGVPDEGLRFKRCALLIECGAVKYVGTHLQRAHVHLRSRGHTAGLIGMRQVDPDKIVRFSVFFTAENVSVVERIIGAKCTSPCKFVSHFLMHRLPLCVCACPCVFLKSWSLFRCKAKKIIEERKAYNGQAITRTINGEKTDIVPESKCSMYNMYVETPSLVCNWIENRQNWLNQFFIGDVEGNITAQMDECIRMAKNRGCKLANMPFKPYFEFFDDNRDECLSKAELSSHFSDAVLRGLRPEILSDLSPVIPTVIALNDSCIDKTEWRRLVMKIGFPPENHEYWTAKSWCYCQVSDLEATLDLTSDPWNAFEMVTSEYVYAFVRVDTRFCNFCATKH